MLSMVKSLDNRQSSTFIINRCKGNQGENNNDNQNAKRSHTATQRHGEFLLHFNECKLLKNPGSL